MKKQEHKKEKEKETDKLRIIEYLLATSNKTGIRALNGMFTKSGLKIKDVLKDIKINRRARELEPW